MKVKVSLLKKYVLQMVLNRFRDLEIDADDIADSRAIVYLENINSVINK